MIEREEFDSRVRDCLAHLYDTAHLQGHPLCNDLALDAPAATVSRAQALRRLLIETLEELRPDASVPYNAREWRPYRVLLHRYAQRMSLQATLEELAISDRQYQREHARALRFLTDLLWERTVPSSAEEAQALVGAPETSEVEPPLDEVDRLVSGAQREALDMVDLLRGALAAVANLAAARQVAFTLAEETLIEPILGDRGLVRQILLNALTQIISGGHAIEIEIALVSQDEAVTISLAPREASAALLLPADAPRLELCRRLAEAMGGGLEVGEGRLVLYLARQRQVVLVVDDNSDVVDLVGRYLASSPYRVVGAATADEALRLAREALPQVVLLDVMMPSRDGWEILQSLKHNPETQHIPVVICSVLNERALAYSLGADDYLRKPITQDKLAAVLARL